jgi:hypothetical protein
VLERAVNPVVPDWESMMPPPTSFTSRTMRDGDCSGLFRLSAASLTLPLTCRKIITLPRVMIGSRRVMINPWGHRY